MMLLKDRAETLNQLAEGAMLFCGPYAPADAELRAQHLDEAATALLGEFAQNAADLPEWSGPALSALIKSMLEKHGPKMTKLAIPLRVAANGRKQNPTIDPVLDILGRDTVL